MNNREKGLALYQTKSASSLLERVGLGLKRLWNPNAGNYLFGKGVADEAEKGIATFIPRGWNPTARLGFAPRPGSLAGGYSHAPEAFETNIFERLAQRLSGGNNLKDKMYRAENLAHPEVKEALKKQFGLARSHDVDLAGKLGPGELKGNFTDYNKLHEAQEVFKGFIPDSQSLQAAGNRIKDFKMRSPKKLREALDKAYGKDQWMLKHVESANGLGSEVSSKPLIFRPNGPQGLNRIHGKLDDWMVQKRHELQGLNWWERGLKNLMGATDDATSSGLREYRIHALNGKVIPYAHSGDRGAHVLDKIEQFLPFQRKSLRDAYSHVQAALDAAPKKYRNQHFGFDVAFDKAGKPIIIEANPTAASGTSLWGSSPMHMEAANAAIRGELPVHELARRLRIGTYGTAGAAGIGGAAYGGKALYDNKDAIQSNLNDLQNKYFAGGVKNSVPASNFNSTASSQTNKFQDYLTKLMSQY